MDFPSRASSRAGSISGYQQEASKLIEEEAMKVGSVSDFSFRFCGKSEMICPMLCYMRLTAKD